MRRASSTCSADSRRADGPDGSAPSPVAWLSGVAGGGAAGPGPDGAPAAVVPGSRGASTAVAPSDGGAGVPCAPPGSGAAVAAASSRSTRSGVRRRWAGPPWSIRPWRARASTLSSASSRSRVV